MSMRTLLANHKRIKTLKNNKVHQVVKNYLWMMMTTITKQTRIKKIKTMTRTKTHSMMKIKTVMVAKKMSSFKTARKNKRQKLRRVNLSRKKSRKSNRRTKWMKTTIRKRRSKMIKLNQGPRAMTETRKSAGYSTTKTTRASTNCLETIVMLTKTVKETKLQ